MFVSHEPLQRTPIPFRKESSPQRADDPRHVRDQGCEVKVCHEHNNEGCAFVAPTPLAPLMAPKQKNTPDPEEIRSRRALRMKRNFDAMLALNSWIFVQKWTLGRTFCYCLNPVSKRRVLATAVGTRSGNAAAKVEP